MEARDLLDSVKFSNGVKKPSGQDHLRRRGIVSSKQAAVRKKLAKQESFLHQNRNDIRKQRWFCESPEAVPARSLQTSEYSRRARDRRAPDEGKSNRRERKKRIPGSSAEKLW